MRFHADIALADRGRAQVEKPGRAGAEQCNFVLQHGGRRGAAQDIPRGDIGEALLRSAVGDEDGDLFVDGDVSLAERERLEFQAAQAAIAAGREHQPDLGQAERQSRDRERERRVQVALETLHEWRAAKNAVGIDHRGVEEATSHRVLLQRRQVAGETAGLDKRHAHAINTLGRDDRRGQCTGGDRLVLGERILEYETGDDIARDQRVGEAGIAVESLALPGQFGGDGGVGSDVARGERVQQAFRRGLLGFREQHVEPENGQGHWPSSAWLASSISMITMRSSTVPGIVSRTRTSYK